MRIATADAGTKIAITDKGQDPEPSTLVFDMKYEGKKLRYVIPNGSVTVTSELPYVDAELGGYECEVTCLPDESGVRVYRYLENDDKVAA